MSKFNIQDFNSNSKTSKRIKKTNSCPQLPLTTNFEQEENVNKKSQSFSSYLDQIHLFNIKKFQENDTKSSNVANNENILIRKNKKSSRENNSEALLDYSSQGTSGTRNTREEEESRNSFGLTDALQRFNDLYLPKILNSLRGDDFSTIIAKGINKIFRLNNNKYSIEPQNNPVVVSFSNVGGTRTRNRNSPRPPIYYTNSVPQQQPNEQQRQLPRGAYQSARRNPSIPSTGPPRETVVMSQPVNQPGQLMMAPNPLINFTYWAPYPENIPPGVPACLAHLLNADALFIIQRMDMLELYFDVTEPNFYAIQNSAGQCLYYAYETTTLAQQMCASNARSFQIHVMDMYHNEIIYLNKACGCNNCFCCYPALEVYSPPLVPVGAIQQQTSLKSTKFQIIDPDENKIFVMYGPCCCCASPMCGEANFTIHALDANSTEVATIRRQNLDLVRSYFTNCDAYGISFPADLDVKMKAVFLGALFLIDYTFYDSN